MGGVPCWLLLVCSIGRTFFFSLRALARLEELMEEVNSKLSDAASVESACVDWQPRVEEVCLAKMHV